MNPPDPIGHLDPAFYQLSESEQDMEKLHSASTLHKLPERLR